MSELKMPMPTTSTSDKEKASVLDYVRRLLGDVSHPVGYRPDWITSKDGSTSVFVTFSTRDNLFYDVGKKDLDEWSTFPRGFIVFVLGSHDRALVVAVKALRERLLASGCVPSEKYAEGRQGQSFDQHLHAEVGHVPAAVRDDVVEQALEVGVQRVGRSEEHTSELQSLRHLV